MLDHLPERGRDTVKRKLRQAWQETDYDIALEQLTALALELDRPHPGAAALLREGMEETLTVIRLGVALRAFVSAFLTLDGDYFTAPTTAAVPSCGSRVRALMIQ